MTVGRDDVYHQRDKDSLTRKKAYSLFLHLICECTHPQVHFNNGMEAPQSSATPVLRIFLKKQYFAKIERQTGRGDCVWGVLYDSRIYF